MKVLRCLLLAGAGIFPVQATEPPPQMPSATAAAPARTPAMIEAIAASLNQKQRDKLLELLGFGSKKALMDIPGIGEGKADAIIAGRPYFQLTDVTRVKGIGQTLFAAMVEHAKAGFPKRKRAP